MSLNIDPGHRHFMQMEKKYISLNDWDKPVTT